MIIKLAALGALGYAGYRYMQKSETRSQPGTAPVALAGGPLSSQATVQSDANVPPVTH